VGAKVLLHLPQLIVELVQPDEEGVGADDLGDEDLVASGLLLKNMYV
jgi:hypothetical protein